MRSRWIVILLVGLLVLATTAAGIATSGAGTSGGSASVAQYKPHKCPPGTHRVNGKCKKNHPKKPKHHKHHKDKEPDHDSDDHK